MKLEKNLEGKENREEGHAIQISNHFRLNCYLKNICCRFCKNIISPCYSINVAARWSDEKNLLLTKTESLKEPWSFLTVLWALDSRKLIKEPWLFLPVLWALDSLLVKKLQPNATYKTKSLVCG